MENNNFQGIEKYFNNSTTTKKISSFSQSNCSAWKSLTKLGFFGKVLAGLNYLHFWTGVNFFRSLSYSRWLLNPNSIFWRNFVYQALAISFNFPAKKLRKIRAPKIRMRRFFFKVNFYFTNSLLFCVLKTSIFFVIFIVSLFNIHIQQLFFISISLFNSNI